MLLRLKNKEYLIVDEFKFKCSIGKNGLNSKKIEGDHCTPIGIFKIGRVYYRPDRIKKPDTSLKTKKITKNMGWCDDPYNKNYNKEIVLNKKNKGEKLFRKDNIYLEIYGFLPSLFSMIVLFLNLIEYNQVLIFNLLIILFLIQLSIDLFLSLKNYFPIDYFIKLRIPITSSLSLSLLFISKL